MIVPARLTRNHPGAFVVFLACAMLLACWPGRLEAIGIALKSGEYFVGELVEDNIDAFLVRYEGRLYRIPVEDIERVQMNKDRPGSVLTLTLQDGTELEGLLLGVVGNRLILGTREGERRVDLADIDEREERPEAMQNPPERYLETGAESAGGGEEDYGSLGLFAYGGGNFGELSDTHQGIGGAGLLWEPAFAGFAPGGLGLRLDYLAMPNRLPIEIGSAFLTLYFFSPGYSFYFDFGGGGSLIRYIRSRTQESSPAATLGFGWRSAGGENFYFKAGFRGQYAQSRFGGIGHAGLEFAGVMKY